MKIVSKVSVYAAGAVAILAALVAIYATQLRVVPPLLLAPMFDVMNSCILERPGRPSHDTSPFADCQRTGGSAAKVVEATLATLGPRYSVDGKYEVGYTLQFSLLGLLKQQGSDWVVDRESVQRLVRTLRYVDRGTVLYLFSTHFGTDSPMEQELMKNPANLSFTPDGPLPQDKYYGVAIHPWTFATTDNELTRRRVQVIDEIVEQVCKLPQASIDKIRGITLLGELHHLFLDFEAGMGYGSPYAVSDYSPASVAGFQKYLAQRFGTVSKLNVLLGSGYADFADVVPPSKDIRTEPHARFTEHIDGYAQGTLPVSGWAHVSGLHSGQVPWVRIYHNGRQIARVSAHLGRQDVAAALPSLGTADVGWRYDFDFSTLPAGIHRIDVMLEQARGKPLMVLGSRRISILDRTLKPSKPLPLADLPPNVWPDNSVKFSVDAPVDQSTYIYNPLVPLWHAYRGQQVVDYLNFIDGKVRRDCLTNAPTYTHQLLPFSNPSWDVNKFAVDASLRPLGHMQMGVSLYGETTYGESFFQWLRSSGQRHYGVTEFHPLRAMDVTEMTRTLDRHRQHGAQFISFFMEAPWQGDAYGPGQNMFSFDPKNPQSGSDKLFNAVKTMVSNVHDPVVGQRP